MVLKHAPLWEINLPFVATNAHFALASQPTLSLPYPLASDLKVPRRCQAKNKNRLLCDIYTLFHDECEVIPPRCAGIGALGTTGDVECTVLVDAIEDAAVYGKEFACRDV